MNCKIFIKNDIKFKTCYDYPSKVKFIINFENLHHCIQSKTLKSILTLNSFKGMLEVSFIVLNK